MKVLLCLLSAQHVPNLLSVHHYQPDRLVLVESGEMKKRGAGDNFHQALKLGNLDYSDRCDVEPLEAEDNLDAIRVVLRRTFGKYPSADWIANVTGGTKPMSIAAFEFFKATAGRVIYTNLARPNVFLNLDSSVEETCDYKLSVKEFLAGYGFESRKTEDKVNAAKERACRLAQCAREIAKYASSDDILLLSNSDRGKAREKGWDIQAGQLTSPSPLVTSQLKNAFSLQDSGSANSLIGHLDKYGVQFLTGGWLEVFIWDLLSHHAAALGIWDVRLSLDVGRKGDSSGNDFDVAFMRDYGLSMVECKSGAQNQDSNSDILYKVEAIIRQFRALRVRSYLVSTGSHILNKNGALETSVQNRADIYHCRILTTTGIQEMARNFDSADTIRKIFFNNGNGQ